jgi:hypothetical protein
MWKIYVFIILIVSSCISNNSIKNKNGSVNLSFDDTSVCNWEKYLPLFKKYDVKLTLYICRPQTLTYKQWKALKNLEKNGHEIACHGLNHKNPFLIKSKYSLYIQNELLTCKKILSDSGFEVKKIGFPFGNAPLILEQLSLNYFSKVRRVTWDKEQKPLSKYDELFSLYVYVDADE